MMEGKEGGQRELEDDEKLLHRAISVVFVTIIKELDDFAEPHLHLFEGGEDGEHRLEWTPLYAEYEALMEARLAAFCREEHLESCGELCRRIRSVVADEDDERAQGLVNLLLSGLSYPKFVSVMRRKAAKRKK